MIIEKGHIFSIQIDHIQNICKIMTPGVVNNLVNKCRWIDRTWQR